MKFHFKTDQGIKCLTHEKATEIAGVNPDYATKDLFEAIEKGDFPSWTFYVQVMPLEDAENYHVDPFDLTKVRFFPSTVFCVYFGFNVNIIIVVPISGVF